MLGTSVDIVDTNANATRYLTFTDVTSGVVTELQVDSGSLRYNPSANQLSTSGNVVSGTGSGGVAMTINDGYGNANLTFNHTGGRPEQNGKAGRIEVNTDSTSGSATMSFELGSATANTPASITQLLQLSDGGSQFTNNAGLTFNNRPAFNGGASGSTSPFTVDSNTKVTNLNADLLDDLSSGSFLRSDANDTFTGTITGATLHIGGSQITSSAAALKSTVS